MNTERDAQNQGHAVQWIEATEAARRLGISARAVQKRCAAGKMTARRITTPQGVRWELDARELANEPDANRRTDLHEPRSFDAQRGANRRTKGRELDANQLSDELARERDLNSFLRGVIEQLQRDAIELRAIARDALKAPRRLTAGSSADAPRCAESIATTNGPQREEQPDEMNANELLELCRRITR